MSATRGRKPEAESNPEDLLRSALEGVKPLARRNRAELRKPRPLPLATQRLRDEQAALHDTLSDAPAWEQGLESGEELQFRRDGLSLQHLRRLRRGHWKIQAQLDLHGLTAPEARIQTAGFMADALRQGLRCVRIVHGKGLSSPNREPVLKKKVAAWLTQRDEVLAYCQAPAHEGGGGAVLVLLRGSRS